ncbi:DUF3990 domain-containing protein [Actinobacillus pleuropneumoniae]|nr:hypothetical protein appser12_3290 [Actinobacillus pleuropneumoniae serovar 12 str. 1096]
MILYHGSALEIIQPDIAFSRQKLDFGQGFIPRQLNSKQ